jgi:hypothetical protein
MARNGVLVGPGTVKEIDFSLQLDISGSGGGPLPTNPKAPKWIQRVVKFAIGSSIASTIYCLAKGSADCESFSLKPLAERVREARQEPSAVDRPSSLLLPEHHHRRPIRQAEPQAVRVLMCGPSRAQRLANIMWKGVNRSSQPHLIKHIKYVVYIFAVTTAILIASNVILWRQFRDKNVVFLAILGIIPLLAFFLHILGKTYFGISPLFSLFCSLDFLDQCAGTLGGSLVIRRRW